MRLVHRVLSVLLLQLVVSVSCLHAQDTITVRTLTFDDITKRSGTWQFPPPGSYEKVLMEYTLKCDARTTQDRFPCGEWDYLTYTMVTDSTGEFDSTRRVQVNYRVGGSTPDSLAYTSSFVPQRRLFVNRSVSRSSGSGDWSQVGTSGFVNNGILIPGGSRVRYLWRASELTAAGLSAGPISGLRLTSLDSVDNVQLFTVRIAQTTENVVPSILSNLQYQRCIRRTVNIDDGPNDLAFEAPFIWDGTSNLVVEMSCLNAPSVIRLEAGAAPSGSNGIVDDGSRRAYAFQAGDQMTLPASVAATLTNQITIAFWAYGNERAFPVNNNVFEAFDAQGRRVLNAHLPWSNGNLYWDAGRTGGSMDRIEGPMPAGATGGAWNHWAFVKNASTGEMVVYRNGQSVLSGTGKTLPMTGITKFMFGAGAAGSYPGILDEMQVWNTALSADDIRAWMHRGITDLHPKAENLVAYYNAETDTDPTMARDASSIGAHAELFGLPTRIQLMDTYLGYLTAASTARPVLAFEAGSFPASVTPGTIIVDQEARRSSVILFRNDVEPRIHRPEDADYPTLAIDTITVQVAGWQYVIDEAGLVKDSVLVAPENVLYRKQQGWFDPIVVYEIGRYITPYGIGLDLGPQGFKWLFDVTDYAPILRNNVTISAGNQQELIDLTFKFITGTPPRDVKQIDQLWSDRNADFTNVLSGTALAPVDVTLSQEASMFRVKTWSSGHRFDNPTNCAEFCQRIHWIGVNQERTHEWLLWTECGDNPVYPQGGTWNIDRTGWCPGAPVDLYNHELPSSLAVPGTTVAIDYGVDKGADPESWGVWDVTGQLIGYGDPNFQLDAAVVDIIRPNTWEYYQRLNPICGEPLIVIQNTGSTRLTRATIIYAAGDANESTFEWTGELDFLQKDTVALPIPAWPSEEGAFEFVVSINAPNGGTDEYAQNNKQIRTAVMPPVYYSDLEIQLKTNNFAAQQYEWVLRKVDTDSIIDSGKNLADNTTYTKNYNLDNGCYEYELINKEGYGLDLWYIRDQLGTGSLIFKSGGGTIKVFEPDFGNRAWIQFTVAPKPTIASSADTLYFETAEIKPVERTVAITAATDAPLLIDSVNAFSIRGHFAVTNTSRTLPATLNQGDTLYVTVEYNRPEIGSSSGTLRVYNNDERNGTKTIRLLGTTGATHVDNDQSVSGMFAEVGVVPNPVSSHDGTIVVTPLQGYAGQLVTVEVVDAIGTVVAAVYSGVLPSGDLQIPVPTALASGSYRIVLTSSAGRLSEPFVIAR